MFFVSEPIETAPASYESPLQAMVYEVLAKLQIPFARVDTDEAISMEDCVQINQKLDMKMVKTLFLCNRQKTEFYLVVTTANKSFKSKEFSTALGIARVSFAPVDLMESMLGTKIGAATVFSVLLDRDNLVQVIFDKDVLLEEWYGCSDGTTTGYMKVKTGQIVNTFLAYAGHNPTVIQMENPETHGA
jgi:Ala-tRNA(Pro) deacylase